MPQSLVETLGARYRAVSKSNLRAVFEAQFHPEFELKTVERVPGCRDLSWGGRGNAVLRGFGGAL